MQHTWSTSGSIAQRGQKRDLAPWRYPQNRTHAGSCLTGQKIVTLELHQLDLLGSEAWGGLTWTDIVLIQAGADLEEVCQTRTTSINMVVRSY